MISREDIEGMATTKEQKESKYVSSILLNAFLSILRGR